MFFVAPIDLFESRLRTEVTNPPPLVSGISFEQFSYGGELFFFANRGPGNHANVIRCDVPNGRLAAGTEPVLDAGVDDLETCGIPPMSQHHSAGTLEISHTVRDHFPEFTTVLNAIFASFNVRFQSILPSSSRPINLLTNILRKSAPSRLSMNSFA